MQTWLEHAYIGECVYK